MEIDPQTYPCRAFIRFTAKNQLRADLTGHSFMASIKRLGGERYIQQVTPRKSADQLSETADDMALDEALFEEIAKMTFSVNRYPELYQSCGTQRAARAVEARIAVDLVETYLQIRRKQKSSIVERLNALLD